MCEDTRIEFAEALLAHPLINVNVVNSRNETPLSLALQRFPEQKREEVAIDSIVKGFIKKLLSHSNMDLNVGDMPKHILLRYAVLLCVDIDLVKTLLNLGLSPDYEIYSKISYLSSR